MTTGLLQMPQRQHHPSAEELTAFSVGQLSPTEAAELERHIALCSICCDTLLQLSPEDTFVALLRDSNGVTEALVTDEASTGTTAASVIVEHPRYEIVGLIAKGGMGEVFKAKHRMMDRTVALKVINHDLMRNTEAVERFQREVKTAARLSHQNIVRAYDAEQAEEIHFLVMEHVEGVNLADLVKAGGPLPIADACDCARQAAIGLQYAHEQGMVHRDLKPHNLMRTGDGTVKILDFGLASLVSRTVTPDGAALAENSSLTAVGSIMGTPDYISPEQAQDAHQADIRSDIYSLGATLHYLLSGQPPFARGGIAEKLESHAKDQPPRITSLRSDVPRELSDIVQRMMSKDPELRFQTPQDVADSLEPFIHHDHRTAASSVPKLAGRSSWRPPATLTAIACGAFGIILAGIIFLVTNKGTLEIDSVDENVTVTISKATGSNGKDDWKLTVVDTVTGSEIVRLPSGEYRVSLVDQDNDYRLNQGGFTLRRGSDVVIKVTRQEGAKTTLEESPPIRTMNIPKMAQQAFFSKGRKLTGEAAKELQAKADANPDDVQSRLELLPYYYRKSILSPEFRVPHFALVKWLVTNYPDADAAGNSSAHIFPGTNPGGYMKVKQLWVKQTDAYPENNRILGNAAAFFLQSDRDLAESLLKKAQQSEPNNGEWAERLGQLYSLGLNNVSDPQHRQLAAQALAQYELAMRQNQISQKASSLLVRLAKIAYAAGEVEKARSYATQLLNNNVGAEPDWNSGNAIHHGNLILGRLSLRAGDVDAAKKYLLAAGHTNGSPQLNSFGPNFSLAKELLEQGEKETVLEYFTMCGKFWKNPKLEQWTATVKGGGIPDF